MALQQAEEAVREWLVGLSPVLPTSLEGVPFTPPEDGSMYQRLQFVISPPTDPVFGKGYHRENIQVQIFVAGPIGEGKTSALARAELLRDRFAKGLTLERGGYRMHVLRTPQIAGAGVAADRIIVPVLIPLTLEIYEQ